MLFYIDNCLGSVVSVLYKAHHRSMEPPPGYTDVDCGDNSSKVRMGGTGTSLGVCSTNERHCYIVTMSLIGLGHTWTDPWWYLTTLYKEGLYTWVLRNDQIYMHIDHRGWGYLSNNNGLCHPLQLNSSHLFNQCSEGMSRLSLFFILELEFLSFLYFIA